jgi:hypothetical protein
MLFAHRRFAPIRHNLTPHKHARHLTPEIHGPPTHTVETLYGVAVLIFLQLGLRVEQQSSRDLTWQQHIEAWRKMSRVVSTFEKGDLSWSLTGVSTKCHCFRCLPCVPRDAKTSRRGDDETCEINLHFFQKKKKKPKSVSSSLWNAQIIKAKFKIHKQFLQLKFSSKTPSMY